MHNPESVDVAYSSEREPNFFEKIGSLLCTTSDWSFIWMKADSATISLLREICYSFEYSQLW